MKIREKQIVESLENRIERYRRYMAGTFVLGMLSGVGILCGKPLIGMTGWSSLQQSGIKVFFCFLIAAAGIATGSVCRRRIGILREHRDKLLSDSNGQQAFAKPVREPFISEIQALFSMLFILAMVSICAQCPVPKLPGLLGSNLIRLTLIAGFLVLCWMAVRLERENPLVSLNPFRDYMGRRMGRDQLQENQPAIPRAYIATGQNFRKDETAKIRDNRSIQP